MKIIICIISLFLSIRGYGCDCPPPGPFTIEDTISYDYIFLAQIKREVKKDSFEVDIKEVFKGSIPKEIKIFSNPYNSCSHVVRSGEIWLIYAHNTASKVIELKYCTRSRNIERKGSMPPPPRNNKKETLERYQVELKEYQSREKEILQTELQELRKLNK